MYIRTRAEALDVLASIVALPERRDQIIQATVAIMQCLDAEARTFLADSQAMLIEDGLEGLKRKRRELLERARDTEIVAIEEDQELEAAAVALDAVRFADVAVECFPSLARKYRHWEIARAMIARESDFQGLILTALKARNGSASGQARDEAARQAEEIVAYHLPEWRDRAPEMLRACGDEQIFESIAADDERAREFLRMLDSDPAAAAATVRRIAGSITTLRRVQSAGS